ncbi:MAG: hypothetical protein QM666_04085 [Acinetobacter sp.]
MKKRYLLILIPMVIVAAWWMIHVNTPSAEDRAHYQAILCWVIRQPNVNANETTLLERMQKAQQDSISGYAYQHPAFQKNLADEWISSYLAMSPQLQQQAQQSYTDCVSAFQQHSHQ